MDPSGHAFVHMAVNSLRPGRSERNRAALEEKYGDERGWIVETTKMLRAYGFNGAGSWSDTELVRFTNEKLDRMFKKSMYK